MSEATIIQSYSADKARHGIVHWLTLLIGYPMLVLRQRELVWNFFRRELLGRFRGSFLGVFWVLIQPIFLFALYYAVFGLLLGPKIRVGGVFKPDPEFAMFLFAGVLAWGSYAEATTRGCSVVVENGNLVKKVAFPCEVLPVHPVLTSLVVYLVGVVVLEIIGGVLGLVHLNGYAFAFPLVLVVHFAFTLGLGLLLANLQVFMRDTKELLGLANQALMFASGTLITPQQIEGVSKGASDWITWLPWFHLLQAHRITLGVPTDSPPVRLTDSAPMVAVEPEFFTHLGWSAAWALLFIVVGYASFMSRRHKFADLV